MNNYSSSNTQDSSDESTYNRSVSYLSDNTGTNSNFQFPPPPRLTKSANNSYGSTTMSDSSNSEYSDGVLTKSRKRDKTIAKKLPPLGIFWDIENCQVPKQKSASAIVQRIRDLFLQRYREAEFVVVCDVKKEHAQIIQELHDAQVNLIHVSSISKNAADEKLRQTLRRFAEVYAAPSAIVLISGDINFAADLSDLRYRKKIRVILVHNTNVADALILCANEHHPFSSITEDLPKQRKYWSNDEDSTVLEIVNLPINYSVKKIKNRLKFLTDNCGGRVIDIHPEGRALVKFSSVDFANRAQRRIQGEDVYGNKIHVMPPSLKDYTGRKIKNTDSHLQKNFPFPSPPIKQQNAYQAPYNVRKQNHQFHIPPPQPIRGAHSLTNLAYDQNALQVDASKRRPRTPQGQLGVGHRVHKSSTSSDYSDDPKGHFQPIVNPSTAGGSVDLIISNFDPIFGKKELTRRLTNMVEHVAKILTLNVTMHADGLPIANLTVSSSQDAQLVVSKLHRQRIGNRGIIVSYAQTGSVDREELRSIVVELLQESPDKSMLLFKFLNLLSTRYHCSVSLFEINKLRDVCKITDQFGARIISLTEEFKYSPPPSSDKILQSYCTLHNPKHPQLEETWCELNTVKIPNVMVSLKVFSVKLNQLISIHSNNLPFLSFQSCYEEVLGEALPVDDDGVPLEHLISCVPNVEIALIGFNKNIKIIRQIPHVPDQSEESFLKTVSPSLAPYITLLCRELTDLLKTTERCQLPLSKFIPAYHYHFGRQLRVSDYGHTKLFDLMESISHVVQIIGDGTRRMLTLSHAAQMRRFTSDLLKVLKVQPLKKITISELPTAYKKVTNRNFSSVEYGLCSLEDLLDEMSENVIVLDKETGETVVAIPQRTQTPEEMAKTKKFALEVVELLRHMPFWTIDFNQFAPAYHHHFRHQCRVSDYGFVKLIELFEAIQDVVKIEELSNGERSISLTLSYSMKILGSQMLVLVRNSIEASIPLEQLPAVYMRAYGHPIRPKFYKCDTVQELIPKLRDYIQVKVSNAGPLLLVIEALLEVRSWAILLEPPYCRSVDVFKTQYELRYYECVNLHDLQQLSNAVSLSSFNNVTYISLTTLYILGAQIYHVIYNNGGFVLFSKLEMLLFRCYGKNIKLSDFDIQTPEDVNKRFNYAIFITREYGKDAIVSLRRNLADCLVPLPSRIYSQGLQSIIAKPDSPPELNFMDAIYSPPGDETLFDFSIRIPINENPKLLENADMLTSPALLDWGFFADSSPNPSDLPLPDKFISKDAPSDDSTDSGVNTRLELSPSEFDAEYSS